MQEYDAKKQESTIADLFSTTLEIDQFLKIAICCTRLLAEMHGQSEIHKHICPHCFSISENNEVLALRQLDQIQISQKHNQNSLLAYISPEQTGRTAHLFDSRSNIYSLGIIFYQLATGNMPFVATDALEWVHCHIARNPRHPIAIRPAIPLTVSEIIMKQLAKNPDNRYQTATGLLYDLEKCQKEWLLNETIQPFKLAANDISNEIRIPQKLYGRKKEMDLLHLSLAKVIETGNSEMLIISGYSGIGKTSLARALYHSVVKAGGLYLTGKFDQYTKVPYSTIGDAFHELIRLLLTKSEQRLSEWKTKILSALGSNARLICDIIPQLELIIGSQPPVQQLPPTDTESRFIATFLKFISVFAQKEHPLVLFLDDLQWADPATLKLMHHLICEQDSRHLLMIGAFRDNEVDASHSLMLTINEIKKDCDHLQQVTLEPLSGQNLLELLDDTLTPCQVGIEQFCSLIFEKTGGNPFFVSRFLKELNKEHLLYFDPLASLWCWNLEAIIAKGYSDNVIDLIMSTLSKRPLKTQELLKRAACIGNSFSEATLRTIYDDPEISMALADAVREHLLLPQGENQYIFPHDRVQQAAYQLTLESERNRLHIAIARLMMGQALDGTVEGQVFAIVNQYNSAIPLVTEKEEKLLVASLNLMAAKRAKASTAYKSALEYVTTATQLVDESDWEPHYPLLFDLYQEKGELEYLNSLYKESEQTICFLIDRSDCVQNKAQLFNILIVQYTLMARYRDAIAAGREALQLLGVNIPVTELDNALKNELENYSTYMQGRNIADLADAAEITDKTCKICLELLSNLAVPSRYYDNELFAVIILLNVNWSLKHGVSAKTTVGYSCFGMFLSDKMNNFTDAYQFGLVALALSERFNAMTQKCQASFVLGHYLIHWVSHLREVDAPIIEGMQAGLASGELQWTGYTMAYRLFPPFYRGEPIRQVLNQLPHLLHFTKKTHNQWASDTLTGFKIALAELAESEHQSGILDEEEYLDACKNRKSFGALGRYYVLKMQQQYLLGNYDAAFETTNQAKELSGFFSSSISIPFLCFYSFMIAAARFRTVQSAEQEKLKSDMQVQKEKMKIWADNCPENFLHLLQIMQGESARIAGDPLKALQFFETGGHNAKSNGFIQNHALAEELAAHIYLEQGLISSATASIKKARHLYHTWGADKKLRTLEKSFPQLLSNQSDAQGDIDSQIGHLDAMAVIKSSQAISGEIELKRLLDTLMKIVMENAGAQKGSLILYQNGEPAITINGTNSAGNHIYIATATSAAVPESIPMTLLNYVSRSKELLIIDDATNDELISLDPYIIQHNPLSVLCLPLTRQGRLLALIYLENNLLCGAFTKDRVAVLELLCAQAAISLENAELYEEKNLTEQALRASEETYRQVFNHCGNALLIIETDKTISKCNHEYEQMVGASRSDIEGVLKWTDTVAFADELEQMKEYHRLRRIHSSLAPQSYEFHLKDWNGKIKNVVATVTNIPGTTQTLAALQDITERKQGEAEREQLAKAIEQSAEAIFITDETWHITYANDICLKITGYTKEELQGKSVNIVKTDNHDKQFYLEISEALKEGNAWTGRMTLKKKDGTIYTAEATNAPVKNSHGKITSYICTHRDISKELKLERDLRQAQKMEAIGTLAGGIAHDFNNLLTAILGSVELASAKINGDSNIIRDLSRITEAGNRAKELVAQILTYSRQREQEKKPLHVANIIEEVLKLLRASLPATIDIRSHIMTDQDEDIVLADATQLHQVLMNLATNAAHSMRKNGGALGIGISPIETDAAMRSTNPDMPHGSCLRITVSDTGHGIDQKILPRIFDPYFTTKKFGEGTGMGLSVVEGIVKSFGGTISVYSEVDKGTTFHIMLPRLETASAHKSLEQPEVAHGGNERILFVDDEAILAEMGKDLFESLGYRVTSTTSSVEALNIFKAAPMEFDLLITDMTMPVLTGKELSEKILAERPDIPIILCTGFSETIDEEIARRAGIKGYVMKPYSICTLDNIVRSIFHSQKEGLE